MDAHLPGQFALCQADPATQLEHEAAKTLADTIVSTWHGGAPLCSHQADDVSGAKCQHDCGECSPPSGSDDCIGYRRQSAAEVKTCTETQRSPTGAPTDPQDSTSTRPQSGK